MTNEDDPLFAGKPPNYHFSCDDFDEDDYLTGEQVIGMLTWHGIRFDPDTLWAMARLREWLPTPGFMREGKPQFQALMVVFWLERLEVERDDIMRRREQNREKVEYERYLIELRRAQRLEELREARLTPSKGARF